ncbi:MAG: PASTA domain-containing protein, partial [Bacillota bacterium]
KAQLPAAKTVTNYNSTVWLFGDEKNKEDILIPAPDFRGMEADEAQKLAQQKGVEVSFDGSGRVIGQSVNPGSRIKISKTINLKLR